MPVSLSRFAGTGILEPALRHLDVSDARNTIDGVKTVERCLAKVGGWKAVSCVRFGDMKRTHSGAIFE